MNSTRSMKSNTSLSGRLSPSFPISKSDNLTNRSTSPSSLIPSSRSTLLRQYDHGRNEYPIKNLSNDDDVKFHRTIFQRCSDASKGIVITNREKFNQALNYIGYDLPKSKVDQLWNDNDQEIILKAFLNIVKEEKPIDERTLEEAFETLYGKDRKHDLNTVDFDKLRTDLLEKGDRFTEEEFQNVRYLLGTENGKVDLKKLMKTIGENKKSFHQKILKEPEPDVERPSQRLNSPKPSARSNNDCNVRIMIDSSLNKPFNPLKLSSLQMKGAFFFESFDPSADPLYLSIGYSFDVKKAAPVCIVLEPTMSRYHKDLLFKNLDVRILLFEKIPRSTERRLVHMSSARSGTKSYIQLDELQKGSYEIIPITFGGILRARSRQTDERRPTKNLREIKKGNNFVMSKDYREVLEYVFDLFDFDDNKQLDRQEYNLWTLRTTGQEIDDNDWASIQDTVGLDTDENISKEKFLQLNDFEVKDEGTTEQDLWNGLKSLGFNSTLELDMMCPYNLTLYLKQSDLILKPTSYVELSEIKKPLLKFLQSEAQKIKIDDSSVRCFNYQDDCGSILFVENKNISDTRLSINVKASKNVALNLSSDMHKPIIVKVRRDSTQLIWFAHKLDSQRNMELDAMVQVQ